LFNWQICVLTAGLSGSPKVSLGKLEITGMRFYGQDGIHDVQATV